MTVETGIINLLLAASGVAALVSDRVRYVEISQRETLPAIAVTRISGGPEYAQDGDIGLQRVRIQVDCYAERPTEAKNVGAAVVAALSGVVDTDSGGVTFKLIEIEDERDGSEGGSNTSEYRKSRQVDLDVWATF